MPAGFIANNDYGTVVVDDTNPTLAVRQKWNLSFNAVGQLAVTLSNYEFPNLAVSTDAPFWLETVTRSGNSVTYNLRTQAGNASVVAFGLDRPRASGDNFGLRVWDSAGRLCFDSSQRYGRVVSANNFPFAKTSGRTYAAMISRSRSGRRWEPTSETNGQERVWNSFDERSIVALQGANNRVLFSPTAVIATSSSWHPEASPPEDWETAPANQTFAIILDVTGY